MAFDLALLRCFHALYDDREDGGALNDWCQQISSPRGMEQQVEIPERYSRKYKAVGYGGVK
jgi:hypothetical protein